jgi:hypothetical protein
MQERLQSTYVRCNRLKNKVFIKMLLFRDLNRVTAFFLQQIVVHFSLTMFESKAKIKTKTFLRHIELQGQNSSDRIVEGFQQTEKELMKTFIADTWDLIEHNECGVGLEHLLDNLYEIHFRVDEMSIELAK